MENENEIEIGFRNTLENVMKYDLKTTSQNARCVDEG